MMSIQCTCPLCGHSFDPAAHLACQTCPLHTGCRLVCCPACGHTTVDPGQSRLVRWVTALLERSRARQPAERTTPQDTQRVPAARGVLADVPLDHRARVVDVGALRASQREQLYGYGILPGCVLRVIQRTPVTVVQIEQIELAIETAIAQAVQVDELA
jgi:Fe2+ transport system protein FeoA